MLLKSPATILAEKGRKKLKPEYKDLSHESVYQIEQELKISLGLSPKLANVFDGKKIKALMISANQAEGRLKDILESYKGDKIFKKVVCMYVENSDGTEGVIVSAFGIRKNEGLANEAVQIEGFNSPSITVVIDDNEIPIGLPEENFPTNLI